jgi:hypothetical protein
MRTKALYLVQPRRENLGIATKSTVFCSAARAAKRFELRPKALHFVQLLSEKKWKFRTKALCIRFSRAAKILEFTTRSKSN